jgi:YD repeat-containing protein
MRRDEVQDAGGRLIEVTIYHNDGTGLRQTFDADGNVTSEETLTGLPIVPPFPPLDPAGALATLLVVEGVLPIEDAAHSVGTTGDHLVHEAISWSVG